VLVVAGPAVSQSGVDAIFEPAQQHAVSRIAELDAPHWARLNRRSCLRKDAPAHGLSAQLNFVQRGRQPRRSYQRISIRTQEYTRRPYRTFEALGGFVEQQAARPPYVGLSPRYRDFGDVQNQVGVAPRRLAHYRSRTIQAVVGQHDNFYHTRGQRVAGQGGLGS